MTPSDEVERFFRHLVGILSESDANRLRSPIQVSELYQTLIPYRLHRDALGLDSNEDYDMTVLRFLAGEGGFASLDPPEAQHALMEEARAINPDPGAFREYAAAKVYLDSGAVRTVTEAYEAYAPPPEPESEEPETSEDVTRMEQSNREPSREELPDIGSPPFDPSDRTDLAVSIESPFEASTERKVSSPGGSSCRYCAAELPEHREVNFCPYCGRDINVVQCAACGTELERGWRFCITCGDPADQ